MNFFIVDNDESLRMILANIIEEEDLGVVVGEANDGTEVSLSLLQSLEVDIFLVDLLMPRKSGFDLLEEFDGGFSGKVIMISRVEDKHIIGDAYALGIDYFIIKPINRIEVVSIIQKVSQVHRIEKSLSIFQKSIGVVPQSQKVRQSKNDFPAFKKIARNILTDLGIVEENSKNDLLSMLEILFNNEGNGVKQVPTFQEMYEKIALQKLGGSVASEQAIIKESRALKQRIRRAIHQALENTASLGLVDFSGLKFERYATNFFDFSQVRAKMIELEGKNKTCSAPAQVHAKKFIFALYTVTRQEMEQM